MLKSGNPPVPRQRAFASGISSLPRPVSGRLWIPVAFRRPAFASWNFLSPLLNWAFLAVGLPRGVVTPISDSNGVTTFTNLEVRSGWGALYTPGSWCLPLRTRRSPEPALHPGRWIQPVTRSPVTRHPPAFTLTEPHQEFACARPFGPSPVCSARPMTGGAWT